METVCADGMCPICLREKFVRLCEAVDRNETFKRTHEKVVALEDEGVYVTIKDEKLMIFRTDDKVLHPLTVSVGDITGTDWVIVGKQESLS
jgi:hypothetical protein